MSLTTYLDSIFACSVEAGPSSKPYDPKEEEKWRQIIEAEESKGDEKQSESSSDSNDVHLHRRIVPSLLDRLGESSAGAPRNNSQIASPPSRSGTRSRANDIVKEDNNGSLALLDRLKIHLPLSSTFSALISVLSTNRSNEDIQSELVEILGFEGDGLSLVEELLRPGVRDMVVQESGLVNGKGKKESIASRGPNYLPSSRLSVTATKGKEKKTKINLAEMIGSTEDIAKRLQAQLEGPRAMFSEDGPRVFEQEALPHVYKSGSSTNTALTMGGKFALPIGTDREITDIYEEVTVPPSKPVPPRISERPIRINDLSPLARGCFPKYVTLNRMQSIIHPVAMNTNENMLVCAPTGAGKTDVALMSIIRVLEHNLKSTPSTHPSGFDINRDAFKIIYVAPMKALAAEITRKFGKRLAWLNIKVRELTGDMQLTKQEIAETQIIVTTPEKWDVVTRKPTGEGELASKVKLLIIDEVHLLNEDRGAVIETIVARTLRQVESSQSLIRIVGLSATLPNYIDVSDFLRVNRYQGLFFFDASFRPVPLEQHFIGVTGKPRSQQAIRNMDQVVFEKVSRMVEEGHQVMVFVHARKETVKTAQRLKEMALEEGMASWFEPQDHPRFQLYRKEVSTSRNKEMKELFDSGFGIHHAGMLRSDRNMMEKMFEDQAIKVLCCTSTLAWGVNLPAHAVVIKGTQVYDSSRGAFMDLSVLDVLQIFGRAGRPGYETSGVGYICTTQDKLDHYLDAIMAQHPIESKFNAGMVDSLNAEIALGTIGNVKDAISWLGYTYLFVRMKKEPLKYGMPHDEVRDDPQLGNKRNALILQAARQLTSAKMIRYDEIRNTFVINDLGRIAAKYYLRHQTVEIFNDMFNRRMKNADLFAMLSQATEFEQIQVRENEIDELTAIMESDHCPMEVKGGVTNKHGKVNILLQAHISRVFLEDFALVSDAAYVAQNAARLIRALLEMALSLNWANNAILLIDLSKAIERRIWPYEHPLTQITSLQKETLYNLKRWADDTEISELKDMDPKTVGELIHMNERHGSAIYEAARSFPLVNIEHNLRPLSHDLLQLVVRVTPNFTWDTKISGNGGEPFYIWIQDEEGIQILQWRSILLRPSTKYIDLEFNIPLITDDPPNLVSIISASDRWLGSDESRIIPLGQDLIMPEQSNTRTPTMDIPYLQISCLQDPGLEKMYRRSFGVNMLNGFQSQAFWTVYHTANNVLVSAPVGSGKTFLGEMAIWHAYRHNPEASVLVITPNARAVEETVARIRNVIPPNRKITVQPLLFKHGKQRTQSFAPRQITVVTPQALLSLDSTTLKDGISMSSLLVFDDLHLLDEMYELAIARTLSIAKPSRIRLIGLTSSLNDPGDLATWLGVDESCLFDFQPTDRHNPTYIGTMTYSTPHGTTLIKAMVKTAYDLIKSSISSSSSNSSDTSTIGGGVILFVPSRSACKMISHDLITQSGTEMDLNGFLGAPREDVEPLLSRLRDPQLFEPILHGIGYVVPNTHVHDLALVLELFASGILRALILPRELCWSIPVHAETVVLLGAQYIRLLDSLYSSHGERKGEDTGRHKEQDRQVVNYSRSELVKMQSLAISSAAPQASGGKMYILCQAEQDTIIKRILQDGLPLESNLPSLLSRISPESAIQALTNLLPTRPLPMRPSAHRPTLGNDLRKRDMMDLLGWTYFNKRVESNPTYYDLYPDNMVDRVSRLVDRWFEPLGWATPPYEEIEAARNARKEKGKEKEKGIGNGGEKAEGDGDPITTVAQEEAIGQ